MNTVIFIVNKNISILFLLHRIWEKQRISRISANTIVMALWMIAIN